MKLTPRILYLIAVSEVGGAQKHVRELVAFFHTRFQKTYLLYGSQGRGAAFQNLPSMIIQKESSLLGRTITPIRSLFFIIYLFFFIKKHKIKVLHTHSSMSGVLGRGVARWAGVTHIIHTVHGYSFNEPGSFLKKKLYFSIEKLMARFTDLFICINQADTDLTKNQFKKPVWYIPNGIELKKPSASRLEQMNGLLRAKKRIGSVANFYRTKGLLPFLELFHEIVKNHSEIHWYVVGEGPLKSTFLNRVHQLHLGEHVHVLGYQENIIEFMNCLDLLVIPSVSEAQSLALLEAMSQKTLTCVTAVGGMKEIIKDNVNGIILKSENDVIRALQLTQSEKEKLTSRAYKDFLENFTLERMLTMTEKAYESIINS